MAASCYSSSHMLSSASTHFQPSISKLALRTNHFVTPTLKGWSWHNSAHSCTLSTKPKGVFQNTKPHVLCAMNMTAGQSDDPRKISLGHIIDNDKARKYWDKCPQPVKIFPWNRALENFIQLLMDLTLTVTKYLCIPLLAVSSLSEMSYCANERKLFFTSVPLLFGIVVAGILQQTVLELSPSLKDTEVPWHLVATAIFFTLLKLPGPYYPYWGRIFIPHFANGGLWRTIWCAFLWHRQSRKASEAPLQHNSLDDTYSDSNKI